MQNLRKITRSFFAALLALVLATGCSGKPKPAAIQKRADDYFAAGKYDEAKIEYMNLLRASPMNPGAIQRLGFIWSEQGAPIQAFPFLLKARELTPKHLETRVKLAHGFMSVGQTADARKEALAILEESPAHDEAIILLAETATTSVTLDKTRELLQKLAQPPRASVKLALAMLSARSGEAAAAETGLREALELDPKSVKVHLAMAGFFLSKKDLAGAGEQSKTAAELAPLRSTARLKYAEFKFGNGAPEEAKAMLKDLTQKVPDYLPAWVLQAQIAFSEKKYDESLAFLANVFSRDAANIEAGLLQGQLLLAKGDTKKAVEGLERLNQKYPNLPPTMYPMALAYLQDGNVGKASSVLRQLVTVSPNFAPAVLALGEVNLRMGDAQSVVVSIGDFLKRHPKTTQAELLLAAAYRIQGHFDEAAAIFQEQIKAAPENPAPQFMLGTILRAQGKTAEARKAFEKSLELKPHDLQTTFQLVELDILGKDFKGGLGRVDTELKETPDSAGMLFLRARIQFAQGVLDQAEATLRKVLELDAKFSPAYELLIASYLRAGKLPQALVELQGLLAKDPKNVRVLTELALIYEKTKEPQKTREMYERLLAITPDSVIALNNLANLYGGLLGDLNKAFELAGKARSLQPADRSISAAIADTLGWITFKRKDYPKALELIQEAAGAVPENGEIQFHLGMAHYMMAHTEEAHTAFRLAVESTTEFEGKDEARRRLAFTGKDSGKGAELSVAELESLLKQQPDDLVARMRLGEAYEKQGAFEKADLAYDEVLKQNPKMSAVLLKQAQLQAGPLHNVSKALQLAKTARALAPTDPQVTGILGHVAFKAGDFTWAYSLLQESARMFPNDGAILEDLAWTTYGLGKVGEARQVMQRVLKATTGAPQAAGANSFLAMTASLDNPATLGAAEPEAERLLKEDPAYVPALMVRAAIQAQRGESAAAAGSNLEALRRFPDFAPAQRNLASLYVEDPAKLTTAYDLAVKARKTLPDDPELTQALGKINYHRKDFASAAELLQASERKRPLDAVALYYLGMSQAETRKTVQARDTLGRAMAGGLQEPLRTNASKMMIELEPNRMRLRDSFSPK